MEVKSISKINYRKLQFSKLNPLFIMKTGIGSAIAILIAESLGLLYSPSAGIITLLSIQNTKKETILVAIKRLISFFMAVIISFIMFNSLGYNSLVFGGFVLVFVGLSNLLDLKEGISMNAVLMTHFLIEKRIDWPLLLNEILILTIGMGIGIVINLIMPNYKKQILMKQRMLEVEMKKMLKTMALALKDKRSCLVQELSYKNLSNNDITNEAKTYTEDKNNQSMLNMDDSNNKVIIDFRSLDALLDDLLHKAYEDAGNTLLSNTRYLISYLEMRRHQIDVLKEISRNIMEIPVILKQSLPLSEFINNIADSFHEQNNAMELLKELQLLFEHYKQDTLPVTRKEFEYRATLFQILKELEYFLIIKRNFILELENIDMKSYLE